MQQQIQDLQRQQQEFSNAESVVNGLMDQGLLRMDAHGGFNAVNSLEERQAILDQRVQDASIAEQLQEQNQQIQ